VDSAFSMSWDLNYRGSQYEARSSKVSSEGGNGGGNGGILLIKNPFTDTLVTAVDIGSNIQTRSKLSVVSLTSLSKKLKKLILRNKRRS
jgi:hypothetical protein